MLIPKISHRIPGGGHVVNVREPSASALTGWSAITSGSALAASMGYEFAPFAMGRMNQSSGDLDLIGSADLSDSGSPAHSVASAALGLSDTTEFIEASTDRMQTSNASLLDIGDESFVVLIFGDCPDLPSTNRNIMSKKASSGSADGGWGMYMTNAGQLNIIASGDVLGVKSQSIRGVVGNHSGGQFCAAIVNNQATDYLGAYTHIGSAAAYGHKPGSMTSPAQFMIGDGMSRRAIHMKGALWAMWKGSDAEDMTQAHIDNLIAYVNPPEAPEKVYILLGHSIIVGSANLANVGPEYAHYDDPIPGLNYAELLACPDDGGVGSCSTESAWATFDGSGSFGPELAFARYITDNSPHTSRIIKCATNGTDFVVDWNPATSDGYTLYSRATTFIDARLSEISAGYEVVGILIADGTNDCLGASVPTNLETAYTDLISALRTKYGAAKVAISRINSSATIDAGELVTARAASDAIAASSASNALIDMDGYGLLGDGIHPDTQGQLDYGLAAAQALVEL